MNKKNQRRLCQFRTALEEDPEQAAKTAAMKAACLRHHNYMLWRDARNAAEKMTRLHPPYIYGAFKCPVCGWWHVGRPNKQQQVNAVKWMEFVERQGATP